MLVCEGGAHEVEKHMSDRMASTASFSVDLVIRESILVQLLLRSKILLLASLRGWSGEFDRIHWINRMAACGCEKETDTDAMR